MTREAPLTSSDAPADFEPAASQASDDRVDLRGRSLREHAARGTIINAAFNVGLAVLELAKRLVVIALLTVSEYGFWGILVVSLITLLWLKEVGISDKYIQQSEIDQESAFQKAFTLELLYSLIFFVLIVAALPLYALIYGRPEILLPGLVLALAVPASALTAPNWIFYRRMQFVRQRVIGAVNPVVTALVTIPLAATGAGYWSLVIGGVAGSFVAAAAAVLASPYRLRLRFERGTLREYFSFSWPLVIVSGSNLLIVQASVVLGEATIGLAGVGVIGLAAVLARFGDQVNTIVTRTLYPAVCAVKDRADLLFESFTKSNRLALMWGVPFGLGLTLFAADLVEYGIGDKWAAAVGVLQVFGAIAAAKQVAFNWTAFMRARGDTRPLAVNGAAALATFCVAGIPLIVFAGLTGYAIAMATVAAVELLTRSYYVSRLFGGFDVVRHATRAAAPSIPAVAAVLLARALEGGERTLAIAVGELCLYLAVTAIATIVLERPLLRELVGYLRKSAAPTPSAAS